MSAYSTAYVVLCTFLLVSIAQLGEHKWRLLDHLLAHGGSKIQRETEDEQNAQQHHCADGVQPGSHQAHKEMQVWTGTGRDLTRP